MDRRSWLWRRKSSEKSPGETESSGSVSSHSERFSDEQAYPNHISHSPEVTSKVASSDEEVTDSVKSLKEKLSAALLNISAKEDLVKQHAKVAEEAVSGWEKAENEVLALKQNLEAATQKNSSLEDRIGHLDGALKECVRQLRQSREEQEQMIHEKVAKKTREWESTKSELESRLIELQAQLQTAKSEAVAFTDYDPRTKLAAIEKENSILKLKLLSQAEELELRIIERDLSTQAAETASKQHLESIKKVARLEAECRSLKVTARKASPATDSKSFSTSSISVESFTDGQLDIGEKLMGVETDIHKMRSLEPNEYNLDHSDSRVSTSITGLDQYKNERTRGRNLMVPSVEINLMDDFLEMERLAALPERENESSCMDAGSKLDQADGGENPLKAELEAMTHRAANLEKKLEKVELEKIEAETALTECQKQLMISQSRLKEAEVKLVELQTQLALANKLKKAAEEEVDATNAKREIAESRLRSVEAEIKTLLTKVGLLEEEVEKEQALSVETVTKCRKLEDELSRMQYEVELRHAVSLNGELKIKQEKELEVAANKFAECQKTIASLGKQLKSLATLEDFLLDSEMPLELNGQETPQSSDRIEVSDFSSSSKGRRDSSLSLITPVKCRNGLGKFTGSKRGIHNGDQ